MKRKMQACTLLLAVAFSIGALLSQDKGNSESIKKGHTLFVQYCVSCHGEEGKGDGPAASALKTRPSDLSTISKRNKGFSQEKVSDQISGEKFVVGHGLREMPVWGKRLRDEEGAQKAAGDLHSLTVYLQSLQQK